VTDELERLLNQREAVPPIDDVPTSDDPGEEPADLPDEDEEDPI
jgi:hypothetical protein